MRGLRALALILLATAGAALAQDQAQQFDVGSYEQDTTHPFELGARNVSCQQPLDFRFHFQRNSWLRPQGSTDVRGVPQGQRSPLPVIIDLRGRAPGRYSTQVEVECLNCGFFVFRNCRVDRQVLVLNVEATAPQQQATAPSTPSTPPSTTEAPTTSTASYSTSDLTGPQRAALTNAHENAARAAAAAAAADEALDDARRRKRRCEDELSAQAHAAAALQAQADAAAAAAASAAQQASDAQGQVASSQAALGAAQAAIAHREEAVQIQINYLNLILPQDGPNSQRVQNAQQYIRDAQAALAAAQAAVTNAQAALAASQAAAANAAAAAQAAQAAAASAQAAASAAAAALTAKERECLGLGEAEAAAGAAAGAANNAAGAARQAEEEAEASARAQAAANLQEEIDRCRQRCEDCWRELAALLRAQRQAMAALTFIGQLNPTSPQVVEQVTVWDQIASAAQDIVTEGITAASGAPDMGAGTMLDALQAAYGLVDIRMSQMAPLGSTAGSAGVTDAERISWLQSAGFAGSPTEAQAVLNQMSNFMSNGRSMSQMNAQAQRKFAECERCESDLAALQARAAGN